LYYDFCIDVFFTFIRINYLIIINPAMKLLLVMTGLFLGIAVQAQTYAPYSGNKANGTAVSKPDSLKSKKSKPVVAEKATMKESKMPKGDFQDLMNKAVEQLHQKDYQRSEDFYTQALEVSTKQNAWRALMSRATLYAIMKDDQKAIADFTTAIESGDTPQKQLAIIYVSRARLLANNKKNDLACQDIAKAKALGLPEGFTVDVKCM
jgi:tetratricopeptide (TPR) repeat protein